jgi:hypothetical protein
MATVGEFIIPGSQTAFTHLAIGKAALATALPARTHRGRQSEVNVPPCTSRDDLDTVNSHDLSVGPSPKRRVNGNGCPSRTLAAPNIRPVRRDYARPNRAIAPSKQLSRCPVGPITHCFRAAL